MGGIVFLLIFSETCTGGIARLRQCGIERRRSYGQLIPLKIRAVEADVSLTLRKQTLTRCARFLHRAHRRLSTKKGPEILSRTGAVPLLQMCSTHLNV